MKYSLIILLIPVKSAVITAPISFLMLAICFFLIFFFSWEKFVSFVGLIRAPALCFTDFIVPCVCALHFHCFLIDLYSLYAACFGDQFAFHLLVSWGKSSDYWLKLSLFLLCAFSAINFALSTAAAISQILICCIFIFIPLILFFLFPLRLPLYLLDYLEECYLVFKFWEIFLLMIFSLISL